MRWDASSWLCRGHVSVATTLPTTATASPSTSFICKATGSCCTTAPKDSSSSSSSSSTRSTLVARGTPRQGETVEMQKAESRKLVIGNIHVLYNPTRGAVKLGQIHLLISGAKIFSERWGNPPVVLCGDFNGTPQI